ncbi:MAG: hypothetical protein V4488_21570, partial [Pseudomonadota bacterium]
WSLCVFNFDGTVVYLLSISNPSFHKMRKISNPVVRHCVVGRYDDGLPKTFLAWMLPIIIYFPIPKALIPDMFVLK